MLIIMQWSVLFVILLLLDLLVFNRKPEDATKIGKALLLTAFWILLAIIFNIWIYYAKGSEQALKFTAGYLLEKALSVDNLFVFLLVFKYFRVPHAYQHKILFWGILGAMVMRAIFIVAGIKLIHHFEWIIYVFGVFLIYTGAKLWKKEEEEKEFKPNPIIMKIQRIIPHTRDYAGGKFFTRENGRLLATPMLTVIMVVELTDVVFAIDSIPAILAITTDQFLVYTSNMFAILGLRSLYFALAGMMTVFHYLHYGLSMILIFVGVKMIVGHFYHVPIVLALGFIGVVLLVSVVASLLFPQKAHPLGPPPGL